MKRTTLLMAALATIASFQIANASPSSQMPTDIWFDDDEGPGEGNGPSPQCSGQFHFDTATGLCVPD